MTKVWGASTQTKVGEVLQAECRARRQEGQDQDFGKCHLKARGGRENPGKDDGQRQNLDLRGENAKGSVHVKVVSNA